MHDRKEYRFKKEMADEKPSSTYLIEEEKRNPNDFSFPPPNNFFSQPIPVCSVGVNERHNNVEKTSPKMFDDPEVEKKHKNKVFAKESRERRKRYIKELEK